MKLFGYRLIKLFLLICFWNGGQTSALAGSTEGIQVYQKNCHLSAEHKQKLAADLYRYYNADNIWDILRREFVLPHYENYPQVQEQIIWFLNHQDFLLNTMTRAAPYLYFVLQQTHKRHLPTELVLLPMIESSYNPFAYSTKGAAGLWQIMPDTASGFGIKQDWWFDGRRDVVTSTRAALDYLTYLGGFFEGNWLLAIAAYDTGEGNMLSAIKKNIRGGLNTDFWSLPLAQETRTYIPRLLALATIISHPQLYPIAFPQVRNAPYLAQMDIGGQIDLTHAAELAGLSLKKLKQLNPGYNRSTTDPRGPFKIVLPIEHVEQFSENLSRFPLYQNIKLADYSKSMTSHPKLSRSLPHLEKSAPVSQELSQPPSQLVSQPSSEKSASELISNALVNNFQGKYTLQPGDTLYMVRNQDDLEKISKRFHTTPQTLIAVNQLNAGAALRPGDKLIIPTHLNSGDSSQKYSLTPGDTIYMVRQGDDIDKIAEKFHTTPTAIRVANLMADYAVQEGDRLVIPTHQNAV